MGLPAYYLLPCSLSGSLCSMASYLAMGARALMPLLQGVFGDNDSEKSSCVMPAIEAKASNSASIAT